jgi:hypothetical protein
MKKYILSSDMYCELITKSKKELIDFIKQHYKKWVYSRIDSLKDLWLYSIKYNSKKIDIDNFFWDVIAINKKENEAIDYDNYSKYWIIDWICKKDFLYHNL